MSLEFDVTLPRKNFELKLRAEFDNHMIGIFGPSGAGKTSLFSLLAGLEHPREGRIVLNGRLLTDVGKGIFVPSNKRRIGVVFQEKLLFPHLNVRENILFGERYVREKRIGFDSVIDLLDLSSVINSIPGEISGGEQQRAAVARALLTSPELLLLDEPFNAVDTSLRKTILPYLKRLRDELDIPILVISHDLPDIQRLTSIVYLIDKGLCRGFGNIIDLFGDNGCLPDDVGLVNTFSLYDPDEIDRGLYSCRVKGVRDLRLMTPVASREEFTMVIQPQEVAISREFLRNTSIQNQVPGKIIRLINKDYFVYCIVDIGIPVVSKITRESQRRLNLNDGETVFCLFKAHALSL